MTTLYRVKLENTAKYFALASENFKPEKGDFVVVRRDFFYDAGKVVEIIDGDMSLVCDIRKMNEPPKIVRKIERADEVTLSANRERAQTHTPLVKKIVFDLKLAMKILNVMYSFDTKICMIQFSSESRVDFRELLKILASTLNCRIDLRQVSVRDETAAVSGLGCCGHEVCCSRFLSAFESINIQMAKDQDISLSSGGISGICGRLKCCLKFEHETYVELRKNMPQRGDQCCCKEGVGRVCDRNLLSRRVNLSLSDGNGGTKVSVFHNEDDEIRILQSGHNNQNN